MSADSADAISRGLTRARWTMSDLWVATVGIGGAFAQSDVEAITRGVRDATRTEHDILAAALNDHFTERQLDHPVHYWEQLPGPR